MGDFGDGWLEHPRHWLPGVARGGTGAELGHFDPAVRPRHDELAVQAEVVSGEAEVVSGGGGLSAWRAADGSTCQFDARWARTCSAAALSRSSTGRTATG